MKLSLNTTKTDRVKYAVIFWGCTAVCGVYLIPAMILAFVNPFWFRKGFQNLLSRQITYLSKFRGKLVKPIIDKYLAFQVLKNS